MLKDNCPHPQYAVMPSDKRYLLRYGSAATEECSLCGAFRLTGRVHKLEEWRSGPLSERIAEVQRQQDEEC